jgi:hypothetical protein
MYTSCGWFFDELSGIETVQVIQYAGRAVRLAEETCGVALEPYFLEKIERAKSNIPEHRDGRNIYEKFVKPGMIDLTKVGAHYAVSSIFEEFAERDKIFSYFTDLEDFQLHKAGNTKLAIGRVRITSEMTREAAAMTFGALHFGEQNLSAGVQVVEDAESYALMSSEVTESFCLGDFPETIRRMDRYFGASTYSLRSLFRDQQRRVLNQILETSMEGTRLTFQRTYSDFATFIRFLADLGIAAPEPLPCTADFVLNYNLKLEFQKPEMPTEVIRDIIKEAQALHIDLDGAGLEYTLRKTIEKLSQKFHEDPGSPDSLRQLEAAVSLGKEMPFDLNLWAVQNRYFEMLRTVLPEWRWKAEHGVEAAHEWVEHFIALGRALSVRVD